MYPSHPICALSILSPNIYTTILRCTKDVLYVRITTSLLDTRHTFGYFKVTQLGERKSIIYIKTHTTVVSSLYYIIKYIIYYTHTHSHILHLFTHTNHKSFKLGSKIKIKIHTHIFGAHLYCGGVLSLPLSLSLSLSMYVCNCKLEGDLSRLT